MKIGFIGLGIMGAPMAANLSKAGHEVRGYNRTPGKGGRLVAAGGTEAPSLAAAVGDADVVALMLPDSPDVEEVLTSVTGVLTSARVGALLIDFSSISPTVAQRLAREAGERGFRMLDAPVSGGEQAAIDGTLSIMVGGETAAFEDAQPVLAAVGKTVVHVGAAGSGQTVKVANQLIVAGAIELLAEAIIFLEASAVDTGKALQVLAGGLAGSAVLDRKGTAMLARQFQPGFRLELHHKDLKNFLEAAQGLQVAAPLGTIVSQLVAELNARGHGHLDHGALVQLVEALSGRAGDTGASGDPS